MQKGGEHLTYQSAEEMVKGSQQAAGQLVRLAEVTSLDAKGRAKVKFFGEDTESGKTYSYIDGYIPEVGDKVLMLGQANTFIIMGAVEAEEVVVKYALKDHNHDSEYVEQEDFDTYKKHTHSDLTNDEKSIELTADGEVVPGEDAEYSLGTADAAFAKGYIDNVIVTYVSLGGTKYDKDDLISKVIASGNDDYYIELDVADLVPYKNQGISLGTSQKMFKNVYAQAVYVSGKEVSPSKLIDAITSGRYVQLSSSVVEPSADEVISIGTASKQFKNVYGQNIYVNGSAITTSDKRKKKYIRKLADKYLELFKKLRPVTYKYKKGKRTHAGFIAQEVEQSMQECGITNEEFGGLVIQENGEYGLRYEEFIALQTAAFQDLQKRVEELERRVKG